MASEVISCSDMFDVWYTLRTELSNTFALKIPLILLTDSNSLFDVISKGTRTSEKRMMLDIAAARDAIAAEMYPISASFEAR